MERPNDFESSMDGSQATFQTINNIKSLDAIYKTYIPASASKELKTKSDFSIADSTTTLKNEPITPPLPCQIVDTSSPLSRNNPPLRNIDSSMSSFQLNRSDSRIASGQIVKTRSSIGGGSSSCWGQSPNVTFAEPEICSDPYYDQGSSSNCGCGWSPTQSTWNQSQMQSGPPTSQSQPISGGSSRAPSQGCSATCSGNPNGCSCESYFTDSDQESDSDPSPSGSPSRQTRDQEESECSECRKMAFQRQNQTAQNSSYGNYSSGNSPASGSSPHSCGQRKIDPPAFRPPQSDCYSTISDCCAAPFLPPSSSSRPPPDYCSCSFSSPHEPSPHIPAKDCSTHPSNGFQFPPSNCCQSSPPDSFPPPPDFCSCGCSPPREVPPQVGPTNCFQGPPPNCGQCPSPDSFQCPPPDGCPPSGCFPPPGGQKSCPQMPCFDSCFGNKCCCGSIVNDRIHSQTVYMADYRPTCYRPNTFSGNTEAGNECCCESVPLGGGFGRLCKDCPCLNSGGCGPTFSGCGGSNPQPPGCGGVCGDLYGGQSPGTYGCSSGCGSTPPPSGCCGVCGDLCGGQSPGIYAIGDLYSPDYCCYPLSQVTYTCPNAYCCQPTDWCNQGSW
ncbi:uncharacterized protein Atg18b isoform X1 [Drosophila bipectinata]|uniref:uncharacterized protein Atg18b isoform X1 n=1 Tax=Drosophila bipectinata TaxID=42026 RepID=UPI0038B27000